MNSLSEVHPKRENNDLIYDLIWKRKDDKKKYTIDVGKSNMVHGNKTKN